MPLARNSKWIVTVILFHFVFQEGCSRSLNKIRTTTSAHIQIKAVRDLIGRLLPDRANEFSINVEPCRFEEKNAEKNGYFQIDKTAENNTVFITGSTGVMAAWGFHYYLTQLCHCQVSWDADQLNLPDILPEVSVQISSLDEFRYYQNTCTFSYSFAWWKWPRWEREIDWMAMNGINLPLAFTGQEIIWQRVYLGLGLDQAELDEHFAGPAFFAWQRMGNFRGWGGPLSDNWLQATLILQHKILKRMRSFGMIPVLPAFPGHVPRAMERIHPNTSYTHLTPWVKFEDKYCCPLFVQPTEPLFTEIGSRFIQEMISEFGTNHVYNCDVFNEVRPTHSDPTFVSMVGSAVFKAMTVTDPDAIWVMQGWLFKKDQDFWTADLSKALLTSVPQGRMLILDLQAELDPQYPRLDSFYGQPFVFCLLHNFGGTSGLNGAIPIISKRVIEARNFPNSTMVGTGLTMEGINQNYIVYDKMLEMGWRKQAPDLNQWYDDYTVRRYGVKNAAVIKAWRFLQKSVYNDTTDLSFHGQYVMATRPALFHFPLVWYNPHDVILAWDAFVTGTQTNPTLNNASNFRHDMIDLTRQSMQEIFHLLYSKLLIVYWEKDTIALGETASKMIDLLQDLDELLQTDSKFLLGKWIAEAKSWGITEEEKLQYEWNARNQITLWGPRGEIRDYAIKQWAGIVADYFKPRWEVFIREMQISLQEKRTFNKKSYASDVFNAVEEPFTFSTKHYSDIPKGDPILKAKTLHTKWRKIYQHEIDNLSPKARKMWRSQLFFNNKTKTKSTKSKQHNQQFSGTTRSFFTAG